ncbi:hypothetical protein EVAR_31046_1 [Eumeta japonica]|uniref:Uncharacterized protein n=1 Tax=Eumeta variegata TaxID=151549 RepID=A0A4C1VD25_EUMVA|nr:hypothetical protein EVAR_31046_1 [Eumeta japonica]
MAVRIAIGAVALHICESEGFAIGCRSCHNFPRNIGRRFLPYKAMSLFPGRVLGKCRVQPEPVARLLTHRPCMWPSIETMSDRKALQSTMRWKDTSADLAATFQGRQLRRSADSKAKNKKKTYF